MFWEELRNNFSTDIITYLINKVYWVFLDASCLLNLIHCTTIFVQRIAFSQRYLVPIKIHVYIELQINN